MDDTSRGMREFDLEADIDRLSEALGDPTRRAIFLHLRAADAAIGTDEIAQKFNIHRTVARFHLEKLVKAGLLGTEFRRRNEKRGPGAGRPAKLFHPANASFDIQLPAGQYPLLSALLLDVVEEARVDPEVIIRVGESYGRSLAAQRLGSGNEKSLADGVADLIEYFNRTGIEAEVIEANANRGRVRRHNCVFASAAKQEPDVVCVLCASVFRGMLVEYLGKDFEARQDAYIARGADFCDTEYVLKRGNGGQG